MPGVRVNFSTSGVSSTIGARGASVSIGKRGVYANAGIPGTGISTRKKLSGGTSTRRRAAVKQTASKKALPPPEELTRVELSVLEDGSAVFLHAETGEPLPDHLVKQARSEHGDRMREFLRGVALERNALRNAIVEIHHSSPSLEDRPLQPGTYDESEPVRPSGLEIPFIARVFRRKLVRSMRMDHQRAIRAFDADFSEWQAAGRAFDREEQERFANLSKHLMSESTVMEDHLCRSLERLQWPRETLVDFTVADNGLSVAIDVDLPEIEDMPTVEAKAHGTQLRLTEKKLSAKQLRLDYASHIHGIVFRLMSEAFATLPSVERVVCSGYSQRRAKKTNIVGDEYLLSVAATRTDWRKIDFHSLNQLDTVDYLPTLAHRRSMSTTGILKPIEPLQIDSAG